MFLAGYTFSHQPQILSSIAETIPTSIYKKITKLLTPIIKSFVTLKENSMVYSAYAVLLYKVL